MAPCRAVPRLKPVERAARVQEITNLVWAFAKIGSPLSEEACALMDMVPAEVLLQLGDESRRSKVRPPRR